MNLEKLGNLIIRHYRKVLIFSLLLTVVSVFLMNKLKIKTQMMDLLPAKEAEVVIYDKAIKNFKSLDSITIGIEGQEEDIIAYIESIKDDLRKIADVSHVSYKSEEEFLKKNGFLLLKIKDLKSLTTAITASNLTEFIKGLNENFEKEYIGGEDNNKISKNKTTLLSSFNTIEDFLDLLVEKKINKDEIQKNSNEFFTGKKYIMSPDRKMGLAFVKTPLSMSDIDRIVPLVDSVEKLVKSKQNYYHVKAGVAGMLVLQRDEMRVSESDMQLSSIVSFLLILLIFYMGFRLLRYTVLAIIPLIIGIIWSMGLTYLLVGSLNLFTAMMGVILVGLGIDYAIHIIAIFTEERRGGSSINEAIIAIFKKAGKGVITGSITTAISFMMFSISSFPGFREFGIVLGLGIISTLLTSIMVLPSLLIIAHKRSEKVSTTNREKYFKLQTCSYNYPKFSILVVLLLVIISILKFKDLGFTTDLKEIEAKNLESLLINDKIIDKFDFTSDTTLAISKTIEDAEKLKEEAKELNTIGTIESITDFLPSKKKQLARMKVVRNIKNNMKQKADVNLDIESLKTELSRLRDNFVELSDLAYIAGEKKIVKHLDLLVKSKKIEKAINNIKEKSKELLALQRIFIGNLKDLVLNSNSGKMLTLGDLPVNIKNSYLGKDGSFLTILYPEGDVWNDAFQPIYLRELNSIKVPLTGSFILSDKVMRVAGSEGKNILIIVVITVFIVLLLDFRSFKYAVLAMLPMIVMLILLVGVMSIFKITFNFVNIIALPIIIGIGIDDGVHLIHRYLIENDVLLALKSTGRGILLTSLTTCAAFGTMMLAQYRGFVSFGLVLVLGIALAYILTVVLLPALIRILDRKKEGAK